MGISESNYHNSVNKSEVTLEGYDLLTSKTMENQSIIMSRVVIYIKECVQYRVRDDLMDNEFSSISVEIGGLGRKKVIFGHLYGDHQFLGQPLTLDWNVF